MYFESRVIKNRVCRVEKRLKIDSKRPKSTLGVRVLTPYDFEKIKIRNFDSIDLVFFAKNFFCKKMHFKQEMETCTMAI